jgi:hypothetical protein
LRTFVEGGTKMAIQIDLITRKKLILIKQLYQQAIIQSKSQHSDVNRLISVIEFDAAIESFLKSIIWTLDSSKTPPDKFQELIQECNNLLTKNGLSSLPDLAHIQWIHSIRNDAQHKAKLPTIENVSDCRTYTRDFIEKVMNDIYGISFESISLIELIKHEKIRQYFINTESFIKNGEYQKAVQEAATGLEWALLYVKKSLVGDTSHFTSAFITEDSFGKHKSDSDMFRAFEKMQETVLFLSLGMNYREYIQLKQITGHITITANGNSHFHNMKETITSEDSDFVFSYCINTIIQIENFVQDLEAPFGKNYWQY